MALYKSVYYYYYYGEGRGPGPLKYFCLEPALGRRRCVACAEGASLGRAGAKRSASSMNETNCSVDNDRVTATHSHTHRHTHTHTPPRCGVPTDRRCEAVTAGAWEWAAAEALQQ